MKRAMILAMLLCLGVIFISAGIVNGQDVEKLIERRVAKIDSLKWEVLKAELSESFIKRIVLEKWWKEREEILDELGLTDRIKKLVNCVPDTMPEEADAVSWVLSRLMMDDKIQGDLDEYNKQKGRQTSYPAVIATSSFLIKILEKEEDLVKKNIK